MLHHDASSLLLSCRVCSAGQAKCACGASTIYLPKPRCPPDNIKQVVLITGCSEGGIGYELCKAMAKAGCEVYASARQLDAMKGLPE
jgi:hypothetical protein